MLILYVGLLSYLVFIKGDPLAPKQVDPRIAPASSADSLRFVACPLPLLRAQAPPATPAIFYIL